MNASLVTTVLPSLLKLTQTGANLVNRKPPETVDVDKLASTSNSMAELAKFEEQNRSKLSPIEIAERLDIIRQLHTNNLTLWKTYHEQKIKQSQIFSLYINM